MQETLKKHPIKVQLGTIASILAITATGVWQVSSMKNSVDKQLLTMENQYGHCFKWYQALEEEQGVIHISNSAQDLIIVEIKTKLTSIEAMLLEIRTDLKKN